MKVFGLTGGIGMGKSTSSQLLRERGVAVVDTDLLARQIVEPGQPALAEIQKSFGNEILAPNGQLRRDELARRVFADAAARKQLENILHPRIHSLWQAQAAVWRSEGQSLAGVVIPLLFETSSESQFDATICVACSAPTQRQRLLSRGWTPEQIDQRISAQWPVDKKMALADFVVWTEGCLDVHRAQLEHIMPHVSK
ncbi:MAG: dephospho-CoA kinase [Verrucomicrobia bacterium]|nr:dephospho-CoA kinase [Verrucomicrobiota bacterium]